MNELILIYRKEAVTTSLKVAEVFHKRHDRVLRAIENLYSTTSKMGRLKMFQASTYEDIKGENRKMYYMNRDGFTLLAMGFTGRKALEFKLKYIDAFNLMEKELQKRNNADYLEARAQGKLVRKAETDVIKELVEYAKEQGSEHATWYYSNLTKLANKTAGVTKRDEADFMELLNLTMAERAILDTIRKGIAAGLPYKEIFNNCKARLELLKEVACLAIGGEE